MVTAMTIAADRPTRGDMAAVIEALDRWAPPSAYNGQLHSGDVGWMLRLDDDVVDQALHVLRDRDEVVAVAMAEDGDALRLAIRPDRLHDLALAAALAEVADGLRSDGDVFSDAPAGSTYRSLLSSRGWVVDPDPWVVLYRPLGLRDGEYADELTTTLNSEADVVDRVGVQRSAFEGSTFTVDRWRQMAAGPGYEPGFDLLRRDRDGKPAAAATGWFGGVDKCAILEPVGTHTDHQGQGHGKAVSMSVMAALAKAGASGVIVHTPGSNAAAIRTYESCGLRQVEITHAMTRPSPSRLPC